jgi:uncharacterized membrane protein
VKRQKLRQGRWRRNPPSGILNQMATVYVNRFGRKGGRGIRPWLLIPKVLAVCGYLGALIAMLSIWFGSDYANVPHGTQRLWVLQTISILVRWVMIPCLLAAMALGLGLLLQIPRQLLRMRWMLVKLALLAIMVPTAHLVCSSAWRALRDAAVELRHDRAAERRFSVALSLTLVGSSLVVVLGRLKPRLGQNPPATRPTPRAGR